MVLPPSTAPEGQATEADWLRELRRWLHLGRKGVIIMIRDAQPARVREFALMMDSIEPGARFECEAERLLDCPEGGLVALVVRERDLDWMNLNRPIFSQRSLRVVLWVEAGISNVLKFRSPDFHDWISHFVPCPPGCPQFVLDRLRAAIRDRARVAWFGPYLSEALALVGQYDSVCVHRGINSLERVKDVEARRRSQETTILDNPEVTPRGWRWVLADQLPIEVAVRQLTESGCQDAVRLAFLAELQSELIDVMHLVARPSGDAQGIVEAAAIFAALNSSGKGQIVSQFDFHEVVETTLDLLEEQDQRLGGYLSGVLTMARAELGSGDLGFALRRIAGLAYAVAGDLESATEQLSAVHEEWLRTGVVTLDGIDVELAAVLYLRGRYTEALSTFSHPIDPKANDIFAATTLAVGGATKDLTNVRGEFDDVIGFLRERLRNVPIPS